MRLEKTIKEYDNEDLKKLMEITGLSRKELVGVLASFSVRGLVRRVDPDDLTKTPTPPPSLDISWEDEKDEPEKEKPKKEEEPDQAPIKIEPYESGELISLVDDDNDINPDTNTSQSNQSIAIGASNLGVKRKAPPIRQAKKEPEIITIDDDSDTDDSSVDLMD